MTTSSVSSILERLSTAGKAYEKNEAGSKEALINQSRALIAALELPSEFIQRSFWAEPAMSANIRLAVDIKLFQHLKEAGNAGLSAEVLSEKTGVDVGLLQRLARHLVAMHVIEYHNGVFQATALSNELAAQNYQHTISFCYDVSRVALTGFPAFFKETGYKHPTPGGIDGPLQYAHKMQMPVFGWMAATPPHLEHFSSFMTTYRAGKQNWYQPGFYPVSERLLEGFDSSISEILLVDVGGGLGHDCIGFAAQHPSHPGKIVLQDQAPVIAGVLASNMDGAKLAFDAQTHDFFTPQPVTHARAYYLHSILHDWNDEQGVDILKNLVPALKSTYSRILINEIVVDEEKPQMAATSMDMMMLGHFGVRERTEAEWRGMLEQAGLKVVKIYTYPGVAESLIEAELV